MNPQPVSLADELRKLAEDLRSYKPMRSTAIDETQHSIANKLLALLAQHAVAEPQAGVNVDGLTLEEENALSQFVDLVLPDLDSGDVVEDARKAMLAIIEGKVKLLHAPAHAAEQPKLTWTWQQLRDAMLAAESLLNATDEEYFGTILKGLLTSPVAPPPQQKEEIMKSADLMQTTDHVIWAREFVQRYGGDEELMASWFASAMMAMHDKMHGPPNGDAMQYKLDQHAPPLAPGEQPPRVETCGMCGAILEGDYCVACDAHVDEDARDTAPPAQERASDEPTIFEKWWNENFGSPHLSANQLFGLGPMRSATEDAFLLGLKEGEADAATAVKQAREGALEELHGRIAIRFAAREPSSGAWAYQATIAKEAYLAALAAQPSPQTKEAGK